MIFSPAISASQVLDNHKLDPFTNSPDLLSPNNNENTIPVSSLNSINMNDTFHFNNITDMNNTQSMSTSPSTTSDTMKHSPDDFNQNDGTLFLTDEYI